MLRFIKISFAECKLSAHFLIYTKGDGINKNVAKLRLPRVSSAVRVLGSHQTIDSSTSIARLSSLLLCLFLAQRRRGENETRGCRQQPKPQICGMSHETPLPCTLENAGYWTLRGRLLAAGHKPGGR